MKPNRSLIFNIKLLAYVLSFFVVLLVLSIMMVVYFNEKRTEAKKAIKIYNTVNHKNTLANQVGYKEIHNLEEIKQLRSQGKNLLLDDEMIKSFASGNMLLLTYNSHYYIYLKPENRYFKSTYKISSSLFYTALFLLIAIILIYTLLRYIRRTILPLEKLALEIEKFGKGELNIDTRLVGNDEVAQVGNAFFKALESIHTLEKNRTLFIQNISHELKTPLMKNNLIIHALASINGETKEKLLKNNQQMNIIINTISQFDSLQSKHLKLHKNMFNLIDIVEDAIEESIVKYESISLEIKNTSKQNVDFQRFVLVLKNMINNAYIHSNKQDIAIVVEKESITISNYSINKKALDFQSIIQAFYQEKTSSTGMGLGMYIINHILNMHGLELRYGFDSENYIHNFTINF